MDATSIALFLIFGLALIWYSYLVWFKPDTLLRWTRNFRSRWYRTPMGGLSKKLYGNQLDHAPKFELWWARVGVIIVYAFVIYVISILLKNGR